MLFVLAQFDVRVGNQIVWSSEPIDSTALPGIEFKMIPSGLHERQKESIYFVCGNYCGISRYEARNNNNNSGDRSGIKMYALAALAPVSEGIPWVQEIYLRTELTKFLDSSSADLSLLPTRPYNRPDPRAHPILSTFQFLNTYGPLTFELWKAGLLRSRMLLAAIPGQSMRLMCHFVYIASHLSTIPSDVAHLLPQQKPPVTCLYNVGISDLQRLQSSESFWATTTDGLLLTPSRDACDQWAESTALHDNVNSLSPHATKVVPTWRDRHRFKLLVDALGVDGVPHSGGIWESLVDASANGILWWASAGESSILDREETAPLLSSPASPLSLTGNEYTPSDGIALIGQFQQYTRQLVRIFARIAEDDDSAIRIGLHDIAAMGLDPMAKSDREFLRRFALAWWDRPVVFGQCCSCY